MVRKKFDKTQIAQSVASGQSLSAIAKSLGTQVCTISAFCKRNGIKPTLQPTPKKDLNLSQIKTDYLAGISIYKLSKRHNISQQNLKNRLSTEYPELSFRSMDEVKRVPELNNPSLLSDLLSKFTQREIARKFKIRPFTVCAAVKRLGLRDLVRRTIEHIPSSEFIELYESGLSLTDIANAYNTYATSIYNRLLSAGVAMRASGGHTRPSRYKELNNRDWLYDLYITQSKSCGYIAALIPTTIGNIVHHLKKHNIPKRSKSEYTRLLLRQPSKTNHSIVTRWGRMTLKSSAEIDFVKSLPEEVISVEWRVKSMSYQNSDYHPDFVVDDEYIEVKPPEYAQHPGVDRRRFVKQMMVAKHHSVKPRVWYYGYFEPDDIAADDVYFAVNWKLFFDDPEKCFEFLRDYGWHQPTIAKMDLFYGMTSWMLVPEEQKMNANYRKEKVVDFMRHFHPHYYQSTHKEFTPITAVFSSGNYNVLRSSIKNIWEKRQSCNIYGLIRHISKAMKDFTMVSMFKPWVARTVYDKLLNGTGTIVDPCMGWGGRMLASIESEYSYIGSDLNPLTVAGNQNMAKFIGSRFVNQPVISVQDAATTLSDGDLLFTSPPYDDTEIYHGLEKQCEETSAIYDNIFDNFKGIIALNVPIRHSDMVLEIAKNHGRITGEHLQMKTANFMGRQSTYEPILVFEKKSH